MLLGYGVQAINPYLAYECLNDMIHQGMLKGISYHDAVKGYDKAVYKGVVKVMAKMGISTIKSYCGAQIFEAVGLGQELVDKYFTWTPSRVGGIGLEEIAREAQQQHAQGVSNLSAEWPYAGSLRSISISQRRRVASVQSADDSSAAESRRAPTITGRLKNTPG